MSSKINPKSINQSYPVAGVDNNSQGFRDNFAATKNNFIVTRREMDDLMNKAVVKSPLTYGPTPSGTNNDFAGESISNAVLKACSTAIDNLGTVTSGDINLDFSLGSFHTVNLNGSSVNSNLTFSNWPTSGYAEIRLRVDVTDNSHTMTIPAAITYYTDSLNILAAGVLTFGSNGKYDLVFTTSDSGTNIYISDYIVYSAV